MDSKKSSLFNNIFKNGTKVILENSESSPDFKIFFQLCFSICIPEDKEMDEVVFDMKRLLIGTEKHMAI